MAVAVLPEILAAFVLAMLGFAATQFVRPLIVGLIGRLPVVGSFASAQLLSLIRTVENEALIGFEAGAGVLLTLIRAHFNSVWQPAVWTGYALDHAWSAINSVVYALIPFRMAEQAAYTTMVWAETSAHTDYVWAQTSAHTDYVWAVESAHADYVWAQSTKYATDIWRVESAHTDYVWRQATDYATRIVADEAAHVDYVWGVTTAYAQGLVAQEMQRALEAERTLQMELDAAGAGTIGTVERLWGQETARAQGAEAAIAAAGVAAVAAVAARVAEIEGSECQRFCSPLGDLGSLLQGLQDAGMVAAIFGLAAQSSRDPAGAAKDIQALAGPVDDLVKVVREAVGV